MDQEGNFRFDRVRIGSYTLSIALDAYRHYQLPSIDVLADQELNLDQITHSI